MNSHVWKPLNHIFSKSLFQLLNSIIPNTEKRSYYWPNDLMRYSVRLRFNVYLLICHWLTYMNVLKKTGPEREFGRIKKQNQILGFFCYLVIPLDHLKT